MHPPGPTASPWRPNTGSTPKFIVIALSPTVDAALPAYSSMPAHLSQIESVAAPSSIGRSSAAGTSQRVGGRGIDAAMALHTAGYAKVAVVPVHRHDRAVIAALDATTLPYLPVVVPWEVARRGPQAHGDESGRPILTSEATARLADAALGLSQPGDWIIWSGDLPTGFDVTQLAAAVDTSRRASRHVGLDLSGRGCGDYIHRLLADPTWVPPDRIKRSSQHVPIRVAGTGRRHDPPPIQIGRRLAARGACNLLIERGIIVFDQHAAACACRQAHVLAAV